MCTRLQSILQHMNGNEDDPEIWKLWFYETGRLDKIRNEDWRKSLPELEQMIKFCKGQEMRKRDVKLATASKRK